MSDDMLALAETKSSTSMPATGAEVERQQPGLVGLSGRQLLAAKSLRGRRVSVRIEPTTLLFVDPQTRELLRTRPNPADTRPDAPPAGCAAAGSPPRPHRAVTLQCRVSATGSSELDRLLGPAARLAIENEALRAEVLAQLRQLRRSRARIVATADESRRRLERDLHDGAQQRLLAVVLDLRLARAGAQGELAVRLAHVGDEVDRAFTELRELAHGIYPAVLTEAGLEAALPTLADVAPVAVSLHDVTDERFSAAVEAGAYVTVDEAIRDAAVRRATAIDVSAVLHDGRLVITADDDGAPRDTSLIHVADRVGALGGGLDLAPTTLRAEIPCA